MNKTTPSRKAIAVTTTITPRRASQSRCWNRDRPTNNWRALPCPACLVRFAISCPFRMRTGTLVSPKHVRSRALRLSRNLGFLNCKSCFSCLENLLPQTSGPNVTCEENLDCRGERHGKERTDYPANDQAPDKDRHDHRHRMQSDRISDNSRSVKHAFEILYHDENCGHDHRMRPVAPLKSCNENGWHPADDDPDIGNHGQDNDEHTNHRRKIETQNRQRRPNEYTIHQTHQ